MNTARSWAQRDVFADELSSSEVQRHQLGATRNNLPLVDRSGIQHPEPIACVDHHALNRDEAIRGRELLAVMFDALTPVHTLRKDTQQTIRLHMRVRAERHAPPYPGEPVHIDCDPTTMEEEDKHAEKDDEHEMKDAAVPPPAYDPVRRPPACWCRTHGWHWCRTLLDRVLTDVRWCASLCLCPV